MISARLSQQRDHAIKLAVTRLPKLVAKQYFKLVKVKRAVKLDFSGWHESDPTADPTLYYIAQHLDWCSMHEDGLASALAHFANQRDSWHFNYYWDNIIER